jgi:hypothetical protein
VVVAVGVVGAFGVAVVVDEDPVLFGDLSLAVLAALGAFGGDDEDCDGGECQQDPPREPTTTVVGFRFGLWLLGDEQR